MKTYKISLIIFILSSCGGGGSSGSQDINIPIETDNNSKARIGELITDHGKIKTPIFMPVGTSGTVKGIHQHEFLCPKSWSK